MLLNARLFPNCSFLDTHFGFIVVSYVVFVVVVMIEFSPTKVLHFPFLSNDYLSPSAAANYPTNTAQNVVKSTAEVAKGRANAFFRIKHSEPAVPATAPEDEQAESEKCNCKPEPPPGNGVEIVTWTGNHTTWVSVLIGS